MCAVNRFTSSSTSPSASLPSVWPSFSIADQPANKTRCLGWASHYFFPGNIETELSKCRSWQLVVVPFLLATVISIVFFSMLALVLPVPC